jgi:PAS domain S-box-containing protein
MNKKISILIIEDSENDAQLIIRQFKKNNYDIISKRVETAYQMQVALEEPSWDLVISDYNLPEFDAPSALTVLQKSGLDIPFIVVSGTIGEETAVALMKAGAHDYIMKNNLARLIPAVNRELSEAQTRRAKQQTDKEIRQAAEEWIRTFDSITDLVSIQDMDYRLTKVNQSYAKAVNLSPYALIGEHCYEVFHGTACPAALCPCEEVRLTNKPITREMFEPNLGIFLEVTMSPIFDVHGAITALVHIAKNITDRKQAEEKLVETAEKLRKSLAGTLQVMSNTAEIRDPYTAGHQRRVSILAHSIAQEMGLSETTTNIIRMAGSIHDIGKISVPAEILSRPSRLPELETGLIRVHPQAGYDILKDSELPYPVAEIVLQHHERLDGSGYPQGFKGDQILLEAQIISVADVVEAMASHRPYRPALGIDEALEEIEKNKEILYNAEAVWTCLRLFREKGFTFV